MNLLPAHFSVLLTIAWASTACTSASRPEPAHTHSATPTEAQPASEYIQPAQSPEPIEPAGAAPVTPVAPPDLLALEMSAYEAAKGVFDAQCADCHTTKQDSKPSKGSKHFAMGSYPFTGHHAHELTATIRKSLGQSGTPATMPKDDPGSLSSQELGVVLAWADAFDAAAAANLGHHANQDDSAHKHGGKHKATPAKKHKHGATHKH